MRSLLLAMATLAILTGCQSTKPAPASINEQAALAGSLPYNPLAWRAVTSWTNPQQQSMSTLYGNDIAVGYARSHADSSYPSGAILALVTWSQRDDPHWFGAKIPSSPHSVEFVSIRSTADQPAYQLFSGEPLQPATNVDAATSAKRIEYLLSQRAAVMP